MLVIALEEQLDHREVTWHIRPCHIGYRNMLDRARGTAGPFTGDVTYESMSRQGMLFIVLQKQNRPSEFYVTHELP